ncbi:hypothetical protein [Colwellia sp. RSH04]|uniref:hypothetical protein n=1 Tax=Colwellia sp. RSH04 TaxID=2305464 RepID=UPI000E5887DD|nr:hypothetical protein [Colwellia sp. RSH04]RHW75163.1 hypothetical protein D1094_14995 [Colwellia sp. RSH04]
MKYLLILVSILFSLLCSANEEIKNYQDWRVSAIKGDFSWVDSLSKTDLVMINETKQGYNFITKLFSDDCNSKLLEQLLNKGVSPKLHSKYESLGHLVIPHNGSGCLKIIFNNERESILHSQKYATSLLNHAILWKNHDAIKFICKFNVDYNAKNELDLSVTDFVKKQNIPLEVLSNCMKDNSRESNKM